MEMVQFLIKKGANIKAKNTLIWVENGTPLHGASFKGHLEVARLLVKHGANINALNKSKWAPLHGAAKAGHLEMANSLLKKEPMLM